jgi:hypothetical protein
VWTNCQLAPGSGYAVGMADAAATESVPARLAEIREQLKLLSDYL